MSVVPTQIDWCVYVRGDTPGLASPPYPDKVPDLGRDLIDVRSLVEVDRPMGAFVIEYRSGMESFLYEEIGRDEDGVYLLAENGETTRIADAHEMFEDAEDLELIRLEIRTADLEIVAQYDIRRGSDVTATYGA